MQADRGEPVSTVQAWRAALIPLLAVPVSLIGTLILFPLFGFSLNTLLLFGLVLTIGLVVDDAIVVVEAVEHHIEEDMSPKQATFKAMEEISGPVISRRSSLSPKHSCANFNHWCKFTLRLAAAGNSDHDFNPSRAVA